MGRRVFRLDPALPVAAMKTYGISSPASTHTAPATCEQVDCGNYRHGWRVRVEGLPADLLHAAVHSGRTFTEAQLAEGETYLVFEAGQRCFAQHRRRLDRPELFVVRDGDWRGNPRGTEDRTLRPQDWVDDFGEHQERLADRAKEG